MVDCNTLVQFFESRSTFFENSEQLMVQFFTGPHCLQTRYPLPDKILHKDDIGVNRMTDNAYTLVHESQDFQPSLKWFQDTINVYIDTPIESLYVPPRHSLFIFRFDDSGVFYIRIHENTAVSDLVTLLQYEVYYATSSAVTISTSLDLFTLDAESVMSMRNFLEGMHCIIVQHTSSLQMMDDMCISNDSVVLGNGMNHLNDTWFPRSRNCDDHYSRLSLLSSHFPRQTRGYIEQEQLAITFPNIEVGACGFGSVANRAQRMRRFQEPQNSSFFDMSAYHSSEYVQACPIPAVCSDLSTLSASSKTVNLECSDEVVFPPYTDESNINLERFAVDNEEEHENTNTQIIPIIQMNTMPVIFSFVAILFLVILHCVVTTWSMPFNRLQNNGKIQRVKRIR